MKVHNCLIFDQSNLVIAEGGHNSITVKRSEYGLINDDLNTSTTMLVINSFKTDKLTRTSRKTMHFTFNLFLII